MALLILSLSFDSLLVCLAFGLLSPEISREKGIAVAFGICDGAASLARRFLIPAAILLQLHIPLIAYGLYSAAVFCVCLTQPQRLLGRKVLWSVPVLLSLDNLLGAAGPLPLQAILLTATASVGLSLLGLRLGSVIRAMVRRFLAAVPPGGTAHETLRHN